MSLLVSAENNTFEGTLLLGLHEIIRMLLVARWSLVGSLIAGALAFSVLVSIVKLVNRGSVLLVPMVSMQMGEGLRAAFGQLNDLAALLGCTDWTREPHCRGNSVRRSREFTEHFICDHGLRPLVFFEKWDTADKIGTITRGHEPTLDTAFQLFDGTLYSVTRNRRAVLVPVTTHRSNPVDAVTWANELAQCLNQPRPARAIVSAHASV
jgi:hypothetical protein